MKVYYPFRLLYLVLVFLLSQPCVQLSPTGPILLLPNTGSSPSNFIFPFQLDHTLPIGGYLLIMMPVFTLTIIPSSCTMIIPNQPIQTCTNLATPNTHLTINQTSINNININILPLQTIVIQFNTALLPSLSYSLQIVLQHSLPNLGAISPSF